MIFWFFLIVVNTIFDLNIFKYLKEVCFTKDYEKIEINFFFIRTILSETQITEWPISWWCMPIWYLLSWRNRVAKKLSRRVIRTTTSTFKLLNLSRRKFLWRRLQFYGNLSTWSLLWSKLKQSTTLSSGHI